jgi:Na+/H+ antiporter NhaD/arsenite permease-like protein
VVVEAFIQSGAPAWLFERFPLAAGTDAPGDWARLSAIFLVGSNVVSNVPFILVVREQMALLPDPKLGWELLAMASTFAGNLTLLGSVANIIVAERARDVGGIGFFEYLRVGLPLALLTTLIGTAWLLAVAPG